MYIIISISTLQTTKLLLIRLNIQFVRAAARSSDNRFVKQESPCNETSADLLSQKQRTLELETKVHPKIRNHGEGPY